MMNLSSNRSRRILRNPRLAIALTVASALPACLALAAERPSDKTAYHLFNPTPAALLREMSTDRPDKTESPYTVDAGHFQIELDLVSYSYDKHNPARDGTIVRTWNVAPVNFKVGLRHDLDAQFVLTPHTYVHTSVSYTHLTLPTKA